jgi:hypothetical protein
MSMTFQENNASDPLQPRLSMTQRIMREALRPFQRKPRRLGRASSPPPPPSSLARFDPQSCTVEADGLSLLIDLVKESSRYPGPIIEIGTLLGITATHMALAKQPHQRIITVDNYCWNPWALPPDAHHALARQVLHYLIATGHVEQVRMSKDAFYATYSGPAPSLVFLDAWHTYDETKKDIRWAMQSGARLIAGHDYCDKFPGVMQIVDECGGPRMLGGSVWVLHEEYVRRLAA